jgi:hypothetical protein
MDEEQSSSTLRARITPGWSANRKRSEQYPGARITTGLPVTREEWATYQEWPDSFGCVGEACSRY